MCYNVRPCRERAIRSKTRENMINLVKKIRPFKCRCQPLKGNRIAADFGNKELWLGYILLSRKNQVRVGLVLLLWKGYRL